MKKKLLIIDITTLTKDKKIYGHFLSLADNYLNSLKNTFEINIVGGATYGEVTQKKYILPYYIKYNKEKKYFTKLFDKIRETINCIKSLNLKADIYIYQCYSIFPILLGLLLGKTKGKKIFLIRYKKKEFTILNNLLFNIVKKKIKGIICPYDYVGKSYDLSYVCVSDYLYYNNKKTNNSVRDIDFLILGTMSEGKDLEMVVDSLKETNYIVKIIGNFEDKIRYQELIKFKSENIEILDKYISELEYNNYIERCKYVILPYKSIYNDISSGVVLDALYNKKPVIVPNLNSFRFIKKFNLGYVYNESIYDILGLINYSSYDNIILNIDRYLDKIKLERTKLERFLIE